MKPVMLAALAALALLTGPAIAQTPQQPPEGSAPRPFNLPAIETYSLGNGVSVTLIPYGSVPKVNIRAVVRVGNINDGETPWVSDLTADLLQQGAAGRTASDLTMVAAGMGGRLNVSVGLDQTTLSMDVLSDSATGAIRLLADVLQRPDFPEQEFAKSLQKQVRNLSIAASQPQAIADDAFSRIVYSGHPYASARLPAADKVAALTLDDARRFHAQEYGAKRTHIYVVGRYNRNAVRAAVRKEFGKWASGPDPLSLIPAMPERPAVVLIDRPGAVQSTLRLGKRVPPLDGSQELEAADTMLGGYFSSRITRNIREDKGYTYSPGSAVSAEYKAAYWNQDADVTTEVTGPALAEIIKEIRGLQTTAPPDAEMQAVKNYMSGVFVIGLASRAGLAQGLSTANLHGLGPQYLQTFVSRVATVTPQGVQQAAQRHLAIDEMSLVVVGDLKTVRPQLKMLPEFAARLPE